MSLRASTDITAAAPRRMGGRNSAVASLRVAGAAVPALAAFWLSACSSRPVTPSPTPTEVAAAAAAAAPATAGAVQATPGTAASSTAVPGGATVVGAAAAGIAPVQLSPRVKADFDRAVGLMRSGNLTEAELEFKQIALQVPQLAAPYVNLGILYRKAGRLDQSEEVLKTAVEHNDASALAWTELGATQRLRGEFSTAAASYERAIAADPSFAPAFRNLGVVSDLYLGDPERALTAFERYKELTGEDKPVSGWIAELRQRTGKPAVRPAQNASPAVPAPVQGTDAAGTSGPARPAEQGASPPAAPGPAPGTAPGASEPQRATTPASGGGG